MCVCVYVRVRACVRACAPVREAVSEEQQVATEAPGVSRPGGDSLMDQSWTGQA